MCVIVKITSLQWFTILPFLQYSWSKKYSLRIFHFFLSFNFGMKYDPDMFWWDSLTLPVVHNESLFTVRLLVKAQTPFIWLFSMPVLSFLEHHGMCMLVSWHCLSLVYWASLCWAPQTQLFSLWFMNFPCAQCARNRLYTCFRRVVLPNMCSSVPEPLLTLEL